MFDEIENLFWYFVFSVNQYLVFLIKPVVSQISNSNVLPQVGQGSTRTVDYMGHFVGKNEFKILKINKA